MWLFEEAKILDPERPLIHYHLGIAYRSRGDIKSAHASLKQAVDLGLRGDALREAQRLLNGDSDTAIPQKAEAF